VLGKCLELIGVSDLCFEPASFASVAGGPTQLSKVRDRVFAMQVRLQWLGQQQGAGQPVSGSLLADLQDFYCHVVPVFDLRPELQFCDRLVGQESGQSGGKVHLWILDLAESFQSPDLELDGIDERLDPGRPLVVGRFDAGQRFGEFGLQGLEFGLLVANDQVQFVQAVGGWRSKIGKMGLTVGFGRQEGNRCSGQGASGDLAIWEVRGVSSGLFILRIFSCS
jgi:hypothetical protein